MTVSPTATCAGRLLRVMRLLRFKRILDRWEEDLYSVTVWLPRNFFELHQPVCFVRAQ